MTLGNLYKGERPEQGEFFKEREEKLRKLEKTILSLNKEGNIVKKATTIRT